uniref:Uncharacterized protein n=1 Tax=Aegilops tauschii subsp. strangulata TaxID=200361 RepID=A0A453MHB7_AEGTS
EIFPLKSIYSFRVISNNHAHFFIESICRQGVVAVRPVKCPTHSAQDPICGSVDECVQECGDEGYHFGMCSHCKCFCFNCSSSLDAKPAPGALSP